MEVTYKKPIQDYLGGIMSNGLPPIVTISVTSLGAVGDGVHDDTAAIASALNLVTIHPEIYFQIYFPAGIYRCATTQKFNSFGGSTVTRVFQLPNQNFAMVGDGPNNSFIVCPSACTLFDGYDSSISQSSQNLIVNGLNIGYTGGYTTSSKAFAFTWSSQSAIFKNIVFSEWTNALRGPEGQNPQSGFLSCDACRFVVNYGVPQIAYDDLTYGYPTPSILGGSLFTSLVNCYFNGQTIANPSTQGMDGLIKTINQTKSIIITGCQVVHNRQECIAIDAQRVPTTVLITQNELGPCDPHSIGGFSNGITLSGLYSGKWDGNYMDPSLSNPIILS